MTHTNLALFDTNIKDIITLDNSNPENKRWVGQLHGCASALLLAELAKADHRLYVVVTNNQTQLSQLETELAFFGCQAAVFPDWEILPYDQLSPHQDIVSERINHLTHMPSQGVLLININTLMQRIAPPTWLLGEYFDFSVGDTFDIQQQRQRLTRAGYHAVDTVFEPGEYAVRGSLIDIYPMGQPYPLRLDLFDDEIETMRFFDPQTQRTLAVDEQHDKNIPVKISEFKLLPAKEFPLEDGQETFRQNFAAQFPNASSRNISIYQDVMNGIATPGIEYYQPLFFDNELWQDSGHLFAYLPDDCLFVEFEGISDAASNFMQSVHSRYESRSYDKDRPLMSPESLYQSYETISAAINRHLRIILSNDPAPNRSGAIQANTIEPPDLTIVQQSTQPLSKIHDFLLSLREDSPDVSLLLVAETAGRREILLDILSNSMTLLPYRDFAEFLVDMPPLVAPSSNKINTVPIKDNKPTLGITVAPIERGLYLSDHVVIISETQLFGRTVVQQRRRKRHKNVAEEYLIKSLTELSIGDPVVHIEHGIGRYQGLETIDVGEDEQEFVKISYADDANIYLPMANLHLISQYGGGNQDNAPLHRLGNEQWSKAKAKALAQIHDVAAELLNVQARRDAKEGIHFRIDQIQYDLFASQFPFEETLDQANAIEAIIYDMQQRKPMDRLICGDVGFGKTEVAMRAAFIAVNSGYQVAVLVPTTLLAQQHADSFKDRFADWPIRIETLSRFGRKKQQDATIADLANGKVDIVIGTHKLLSENVKFANLGLMIVDEEHRFGVRHKERIKAMRTDVDMLTLTATPIPRTLNMAMSGLRDMSLITTPPARRLPIKTFIMQKSDEILKEAILREILRGGQVYLLHNDVASIERVAENIRELVPEARVGIGHGQLRERQLEQVMQDFYHKKFNVLVCTTIIETGIDIPNANTIIIERADKFGLAQLHQLRGRVGRSHHQAYAYLLVPSLKALKGDAKKRLSAVERNNTLGAGFMLASEDLDIRGAGELLGEEQSGNMQQIGFSLYMDMLGRATKAIKAGKQPELDSPLSITNEINLNCSALLPKDYVNDVHQRLVFYKQISNAEDVSELMQIRTELIDRFGVLPEATKNLFAIHELRLQAEPLLIKKINATNASVTLEFAPETPVEATKIIKLIQSDSQRFRMFGASGIKFIDEDRLQEPYMRIEVVKELLAKLSS